MIVLTIDINEISAYFFEFFDGNKGSVYVAFSCLLLGNLSLDK